MKFLSLFAGIGGFELGFERAGMACKQQVEIDDNCNQVLAHHWPDVERFKDVKDVGRHNLETVNLVCGGFPCQDVSVAGRREGLGGERSGLWFEFIRVVEELGPKWVVVENVPGLLSSNGRRDFAAVLSGLGQRGYWWAYRVLDAQFFGVPQRRRRVFVVGCLAKGRAQEVLFERESSPWDIAPGRETGAKPAYALAASVRGTGDGHGQGWNSNYVIPPLDSPNEGRRLATGDHLVFPGMAQSGAGWAPPSLPIDEDRSGPLDTKRAQCVAYQCHGSNVGPMGTLRKGEGTVQSGVPFVCNAFNGYTGRADDNDAQGWHLIPFDTTQITSGLNRNNPQPGDPCHPLAAGAHPPTIAGYGVRRLTPTECERLQGFPDGWTAVNGMSDSARYRMLGNAVCVPVAEWLGKRIVMVERGEI